MQVFDQALPDSLPHDVLDATKLIPEEVVPLRVIGRMVPLVPAAERTDFSHRLIWHGRKVCQARKPRCEVCVLAPYCPSEGVV